MTARLATLSGFLIVTACATDTTPPPVGESSRSPDGAIVTQSKKPPRWASTSWNRAATRWTPPWP